MNEDQREIQRQFRQQQERYVYYVLALSVSSIGLGIYRTSGLPLKWSQIPLGISVICWGISIFCGLMFVKYVLSNLYANNAYFEISNGRHPYAENSTTTLEADIKTIKKAIESNGQTAEKHFNWQGRLFYTGIVFFILWHILEMYFLSNISLQ